MVQVGYPTPDWEETDPGTLILSREKIAIFNKK
jgi:hypothetical protein